MRQSATEAGECLMHTYARSGRKTLEIVVQKGGSIEDCVPMCSCLVSNGGASAGCPPPGIIILMRTQGEIESAICEGISRFEQDYMGRGPKVVHAHLLGDLLVVRLQGVLTAAEQQLVKSLSREKGRDLLKEVRTQLRSEERRVGKE